jgi:hypothetical protein
MPSPNRGRRSPVGLGWGKLSLRPNYEASQLQALFRQGEQWETINLQKLFGDDVQEPSVKV